MGSAEILDLAQMLGGQLDVATALFLAGLGLILVNLLSHRLVASYDRRARHREQVQKNLKPLLRATGDLISRLVEILITQKKPLIDAIEHFNPQHLEQRLESEIATSADFNRHETTAYRLINFLTLAHYFGRETSEIPSFRLLDRAEYFLQHKHAVGLRGNLYHQSFLSTELQEDLATSYLECDKSARAVDLSLGMFLAQLKAGRYPLAFFEAALKVVTLVPPYTTSGDSIDRSDDSWRHTLALAHLAIYLIDFYQELAHDPQWEEHRVFFVRLVRQWNADSQKHRYLYEPGDLGTSDYLRTFPSPRTSRQSSLYALPRILGIRDAIGRFRKSIALNLRGARYGRRHHPKRVRRWGVRVKTDKRRFDVRWDTDLRSTLTAIRGWLDVRLLEL